MAFFWIVVILSLAFVAGWYFMPKGWLTRAVAVITAGFTTAFTELSQIVPVLADQNWHTVLEPKQAGLVIIILNVLMVFTYGRKKG